MKSARFAFGLCTLLCMLCSPAAYAWTYDPSSGSSTSHSVQMRVGAEFTKKWDAGVALQIEEDLRFDLGGRLSELAGTATTPAVSAVPASFNKSYTTLSLSYKHPRFKYLKGDAGYTLKIMGNKNWSDVNKWMRHRLFFSLTGSYRYEQWSFSLRERFMTEIRMGDIDQLAEGSKILYEHNRADWFLRSKIEVAYHVMSKPLKPYVWIEMVNTLNANEVQNNGAQYIRRVRTTIGTVWKINRSNALDFYYRFNYGYERDANIKPNKGIIILTEEKSFQHAIGIAYNFDW